MRKDKSKSKHADDHLSSHAEKQLKREKTKSFQDMAEEEQTKLLHTLTERKKELNCLYRLSKLIENPGITLEGIFERLIDLIPLAWQYPEITCTRIIFEDNEFKVNNFKDTKWKQSADLLVFGEKVGYVEVCYLEEKPESYEGPFLKEERDLLEMVTERLGRVIERKKMEELLKESDYKSRSIFDLSPQAIVLTELETGKIIDVNKNFCELTGYDKREVLGRTSIEVGFFSKDDRKTFIKELKSKGYVYGLEKDFRSTDGSVLSSLMFSKIIKTGSDSFILNIFVDITDRKQSEKELSKYREHLEEMVTERTAKLEKAHEETRLYRKRIEALINSSKDFILLKDKDFRYLIVNKAHENLFNTKVCDIIGKTDFDFMPKELAELCRKSDEKVLICKDPIESEETLNGRVFHEIKQRVTDEKGEIIGIAAIIRDITDRKRTERELTESKELFQTLSSSLLKIMEDQRRHIARELHDEVGQQLTVLSINLQNAQKLSNSKEYLKPLNESMAIVESLVQLVRNLSLELRPSILDDLGLVPALRKYVKRLEQEAGGVIDFVADSLYHRFPSDIETTCFRVAQEALTNAIKHSKAQKVRIELRQMENNLQLTILDDGIGFDTQSALKEAKMGRSFGLLGMYERIFLIGGTIKIESTPGKGTKIQVYIPLGEDS